ncbi:MAG: metallophosphoesterase, partial [Myxococcales bacterium]
MKPRIVLGTALFLALSCLRPSEERASADLEVGQAQQGVLSVNVDDGLAAVRALDDDQLVLWGSAPSYSFELTASVDRQLRVDVQNCLPDAELQVLSGNADVTPLEDSGTPTRKSWRVAMPAGTLRLG